MVKCKYEGTGSWNGRCTGTKEVDPCPGYGKCKQYKPNHTTNADRIRAMSDKELAVAIAEYAQTGACNDFGISVNVKCCGDCTKCIGIIEWLQQPAEENDYVV